MKIVGLEEIHHRIIQGLGRREESRLSITKGELQRMRGHGARKPI
jgi:hypothetical protein